MKRYAIVRVDKKDCGNCEFTYKNKNGKVACKIGGIWQCDNYGDTKEQLVRKVAQVIFKSKLERYRQVWKCECSETEKRCRYNGSLILAQKIIEFLGVE